MAPDDNNLPDPNMLKYLKDGGYLPVIVSFSDGLWTYTPIPLNTVPTATTDRTVKPSEIKFTDRGSSPITSHDLRPLKHTLQINPKLMDRILRSFQDDSSEHQTDEEGNWIEPDNLRIEQIFLRGLAETMVNVVAGRGGPVNIELFPPNWSTDHVWHEYHSPELIRNGLRQQTTAIIVHHKHPIHPKPILPARASSPAPTKSTKRKRTEA